MSAFEGFRTMNALRNTSCRDVPEVSGVYMVVRNDRSYPGFRETSFAGPYKGKDPSVPIYQLEQRWITDAIVLYIGKAGGTGIKQGLRSRLKKYVRTGFSKNSARWGGRLIWQLEGAPNLLLCWKIVIDQEPLHIEHELLTAFFNQYGRKPFAND